MPLLRILCPITNKSLATSIEISVEHKASLPNIIKFSYCPYCHALHGWTPDEAFFDEAADNAFKYKVEAAQVRWLRMCKF